MKVIDLTQLFTSEMPVFPGDKAPVLEGKYFEDFDVTMYRIMTSMHVGTHMDGPLHMVKGGRKLSEISPDRFIANGVVIDVEGRDKIDADCLAGKEIKEGNCVLFYTGYGKKFRDADYFTTYPEMTEKLAEKLVDLKVKFIGTDACGPDNDPYTVHRILLGKEILILENLTNLDQLLFLEKFEVFALPAKFDADGAPVRVVARITE